MSEYIVDGGDLSRDRSGAIAVWRSSLGDGTSRQAKFDWFYRDAPQGAMLRVLRDPAGECIIGTAGVGWRTMHAGGLQLRAGLLADMAVTAAHRTLGPALQLQRDACEHALRDGDLVYGFPNTLAVPVVRRLGYLHVGDMVQYVRVLRHGPYLARHMPGLLARSVGWMIDRAMGARDATWNLPGGRVRAYWQGHPPDAPAAPPHAGERLQAMRDNTSLEWRFSRCPLREFHFLLIHGPDEATPSAWFACHQDGRTLRVADYGVAAGLGIGRAIARLLEATAKRGNDAVAFDACIPDTEAAALRKLGFRARRRRPVYARWKDLALSSTPIRLTSFDEDE